MVTEKILLRLLDYENLKDDILLDKIANVLDLQYFIDEITKIYTLAGKDFVIDFQDGSFKLVFVNERYYKNFKYVEYYLNKSYSSGDRLLLYNYLKYFTMHDKAQSTNQNTTSSSKNSSLCDCINSYKYCESSSFAEIVNKYANTNVVYNIFTHNEEYHFYEPFFLPITKSFIEDRLKDNDFMTKSELVIDYITPLFHDEFDLSVIYDVSTFDRTIFKFFLSFSSNFYYSNVIGSSKIMVMNDWRVIVDGCYKKKESFLFKKGLVIKKSVLI